MLTSLNAGVSGLQQFQQKLDVIGNNIANSNTLGFKSARADFEDTFSQSLSTGATSQIQVGTGVSTASVRSNFRTGTFDSTGVESHLAIENDGFFTVRDTLSGNSFVTRAGDFHVDSLGYLVTNNGFRVQGFSDSGLTTRGDIRIDDSGKPTGETGTFKNYHVDKNGRINVGLDTGTSFIRGQVLLQRFMDPNSLTKEGNNLFSVTDASGAVGAPGEPNTNGLGLIHSTKLESSNVDLATEFSTMIVTQRGFQASARIITTSDEILQEIVNLKR